MVSKDIDSYIKLQIPAAKATPAPPIGPALGQKGINIMQFCKAFNEATKDKGETVIPVIITVYKDKSFTFELKTPPAAVLIRQKLKIEKGSGEPNRTKVGKISKKDLYEIAEQKMKDLNAFDIEKAASMIAGTAKSMGVEVEV
ncbi:MAG: 50S ribosomal protein L11 [Candidatus Hydrogenedentota bacterium]